MKNDFLVKLKISPLLMVQQNLNWIMRRNKVLKVKNILLNKKIKI